MYVLMVRMIGWLFGLQNQYGMMKKKCYEKTFKELKDDNLLVINNRV